MMKGDCDANENCLWRPNKKTPNWGIRNYRSRRFGACDNKPDGYNPCYCKFKNKQQCKQWLGKCKYNKNLKGENKCQLKPGKTDENCMTPSPTPVCNSNGCYNTLVCDDGSSDTSSNCCSGTVN